MDSLVHLPHTPSQPSWTPNSRKLREARWWLEYEIFLLKRTYLPLDETWGQIDSDSPLMKSALVSIPLVDIHNELGAAELGFHAMDMSQD